LNVILPTDDSELIRFYDIHALTLLYGKIYCRFYLSNIRLRYPVPFNILAGSGIGTGTGYLVHA